MKADGTDAAAKVAAQNQNAGAPQGAGTDVVKKPTTFKDWLMGQSDKFNGLIPKGTVTPDRFVRAAIIEITNNPKLMACDRNSIIMAIGQCARYGLEPGALLGQAWLIPYNVNKQVDGRWVKVPTCNFQLGYKGLIELARRSGTIKSVSAEIVYKKDFESGNFQVVLGLERSLVHTPNIFEDRGEAIGYYAVVKLTNGETQFVAISKKDAEAHRQKFSKVVESKSNDKEGKYKSKETVWDTDFDAMALKTVLIKTFKLCPISVEAQQAIAREEAEDAGVEIPSGDAADVIMGEVQVMDDDEPDPDTRTVGGSSTTVAAEGATQERKPEAAPHPAMKKASEIKPKDKAAAEEPAADPAPAAEEAAALNMGVPENPEVGDPPSEAAPAQAGGADGQPGLGIF